MSFLKKTALFSLFFIPAAMANVAETASTNQYFYAEVNAGYARQNYLDNKNYQQLTAQPGPGVNYNNNGNASGGFSSGLDLGYQFNQYVAMELGWYYLPSVNVMQSLSAPAYLTSYALYFATKLMMPISWMHNTDAFVKAGVAYRQATYPWQAIAPNSPNGSSVTNRVSKYIRPMFATGLDYHFTTSWMGSLQYTYFMGANNSFPQSPANLGALGTVGANVFTAGLGYIFA